MALCALNKDIYSGSEIVLCAVTRVTKELLGCATGRRIACHAVKTTAQAVERFVIKPRGDRQRSEEHTSELQSLMRISYAAFCLKKKKHTLLPQLLNTPRTYTNI